MAQIHPDESQTALEAENIVKNLNQSAILVAVADEITDPGAKDSKKKKKKDKITEQKKIRLFSEIGFEYSDNIFNLSDSQETRLTTNDATDQATNRYSDMNSISEQIIAPAIGAKFQSKNPATGNLSMTSILRYNYYTKNAKGSFPEGRIKLERDAGENAKLEFDGKLSFGKFKKNYLSGVQDANSNGNITREERIYSSAIYDDFEGKFAYKYALIKNKHKKLSDLNLVPFVGYRWRNYNSTFSNRSYKLPYGGLELALQFYSRFGLRIQYQYGEVDSKTNQELFLYDETISKIDANGDGKLKENAPVISMVDRSSKRKTIEIAPSWKLSRDTLLFMEFSRRTETYTTGNSLDISRYGQDAYENKFKTGFKFDISKKCSGEIEYSRTNSKDSDDDKSSEKKYLVSLQMMID